MNYSLHSLGVTRTQTNVVSFGGLGAPALASPRSRRGKKEEDDPFSGGWDRTADQYALDMAEADKDKDKVLLFSFKYLATF